MFRLRNFLWILAMETGMTFSLTKRLILLTLVAGLGSPASYAEIYKYRDANGKWQFTDKKPESSEKAEVLNYGEPKHKPGTETEPEHLQNNHIESVSTDPVSNPISTTSTPVEKTAAAVIGIKTMLSTGSGFFVSSDGYILTNKHVIHPDTETYAAKLEEEKLKLQEMKQILKRQKENLKIADMNIKTLQEAIKGSTGQDHLFFQSELKAEKLRRKRQSESYQEQQQEYRTQTEAYEEAKNLLLTASSAGLSQHFEITLKDGTTSQALLVSVSTSHDLALLKADLDNIAYIDISQPHSASQGTSVFAIGNPLGLNNYVTAGVIAQVDDKQIYTDAQILPGNSGGPLISSEGDILGINTAKLTNNGDLNNQGFGIAIPVTIAISEFRNKIKQPE